MEIKVTERELIKRYASKEPKKRVSLLLVQMRHWGSECSDSLGAQSQWWPHQHRSAGPCDQSQPLSSALWEVAL